MRYFAGPNVVKVDLWGSLMRAPAVAPSAPLSDACCVFDLLTRGPSPLGVDCAALPPTPGLSIGFLSLPRLRRWVTGHPDEWPVRRALWQLLADRARGGDPKWRVAAVAMAAPALSRQLDADMHRCRCAAEADAIRALLAAIDAGTADTRDWLA